jgi:hypothetical protein
MPELSDPAAESRSDAPDPFDLIGVVEAMQSRLFARVNLADADYGALVENGLEAEALASFREELAQVSQAEGVAWLIARMARLEARVDALTRALHRLDAAAAVAPALAAAPAAELDGSLVLMDENVVQDGFYYSERTGDGVRYRWLGPDPVARVYLPKVKPPVELRLVVTGFYKGVELAATRVALNDGPWSPVEVIPGEGKNILRCRPFPGPGGDGLMHHIDIDCGATFSPADEGRSDARRLGLALAQIEIAGVR